MNDNAIAVTTSSRTQHRLYVHCAMMEWTEEARCKMSKIIFVPFPNFGFLLDSIVTHKSCKQIGEIRFDVMCIELQDAGGPFDPHKVQHAFSEAK